MSSGPRADVAVVIVSWNTVDLLDECLVSVTDHGVVGLRTEVWVVDNASTDGSVEHLRGRWPHVNVIANDVNVGFCRANNQAIAATDAPLLLLANTDARLTPGCVAVLLDRLASDPQAGIVAPRLVYGDGSFQRWTAGADLGLGSVAGHFLGLDRVAAWVPALQGVYLRGDTDRAFEPGWVSSAVMVVRRQTLDEVGPFDESIFVYMDDVDLCRRARDGGWHVWYDPAGTAVHLMGGSWRRPTTGRASPEAVRSLHRWYERSHGRRAARAARSLEVIGVGARAAVTGVRWAAGGGDTSRHQLRRHLSHLRLTIEPTRPGPPVPVPHPVVHAATGPDPVEEPTHA